MEETQIAMISVVVPAYNAAGFIRTSYDNIIAQHLPSFEIIYVDNNSSDNTLGEIQNVASQDARVRFYQEKIQGAAAARNKGLKESKGAYIYMYDVDDQIFPNAIQSLYDVLVKHPEIDAVFGNMLKSYDSIEAVIKPAIETNKITIHAPPFWGLQWFRDLTTVVGPPAFLYRKKVFDIIGHYEIALRTGQDTALDIKLGMLANIAHLDRYIYLYLKHDNSTTQKVKKDTNRVFMQWNRYAQSHLHFYLEHDVPYEFKKLLFRSLFLSVGKMVYLTKGFSNRKKLKVKLLQDLERVKIPTHLMRWYNLLTYIPSKFVFKAFLKYLDQYFLKSYLSKHTK